MSVRRITLFLFGGVSNIAREPPSPSAEAIMAIVGPLTSLLIGFGLVVIGGAMIGDVDEVEAARRLGPVLTLILWLGPLNVMIGLFNLLPGFPLDGGRILRALLWVLSGDLRRATRWASAVGQAVGWTFIALGLSMTFGLRVPFFGVGPMGGLWLIFIGWFLTVAARQSYANVYVEEALGGYRVRDLMRDAREILSPDDTLDAAVHERFLRSDARGFPVVVADRLVGLLAMEDVRRVASQDWAVTRVGEVMRPASALSVAHPDEPVSDAARALAELDVAQLPVIEPPSGRLVGMLLSRDIARWIELTRRGPQQRGAPPDFGRPRRSWA
jgi:CBS domain-containing protein/Zn-dependent protease